MKNAGLLSWLSIVIASLIHAAITGNTDQIAPAAWFSGLGLLNRWLIASMDQSTTED